MDTGYLDGLQARLKSLEPGQAVRIHEATVAEAQNEYYRKWNREHWPATGGIIKQDNEPATFADWCKSNGFIIFNEPTTDYIAFERRIDA